MKLWTMTLLTAITGVAGYVSYRFAKSELAAEVYRARLENLAKDYESLRATYNEAVRKSVVTELVVKNNELCVVVRGASGELKTIETPFDPKREIYVDYALIDGRLLIRRVFDDRTPPAQGLVVEGALAGVDWDAPGASHGKAVYRTLAEGRWAVNVTGNGALGLTKIDDSTQTEMVASPQVKDYGKAVVEADTSVGEIGIDDVVRGWVAGP